MTYVCITGNEQSPAALLQRLERVLASHPRVLCELRLDFLDLTPASAFGFLARLPAEMAPRLILTQRLKASGVTAGGQCTWDVMTWQSWWRDVMALKPWFAVDLDWLVLDRLAGESLAWRGKFRSQHAFFSLHAPLAEAATALPELLASAREHGAGVKLAVPVTGARDLAQFSDLCGKWELPIQICVAMGMAGRAWRWSRLAGDVSYFSAESARATAPGQEPLDSVLPYISRPRRPDLYLLLGDNPENQYGEDRWNRAFLKRGAVARYINSPSVDEAGASWAERSLHWMERAGIKGASVTKPYKLSFPSPTNTLKIAEGGWQRADTDGEAVASILRRYGVPPGASVVIAGGGGAAQAVKLGLKARGYDAHLWVREKGELGECPAGEIFISTWPGTYQEALVKALPPRRKFSLVVDAQFSRALTESPLANWCEKNSARYVPGAIWWKEQARAQDLIWFGENRLGAMRAKVLALAPASKSETLRALALCAACGVPGEIHGPAQNEDAEVFLNALERLGVSVDRAGEVWRLFPPRTLTAPKEAIPMGDGATGFRILGALSVLMKGSPLKLSGSSQLEARPSDELREGLNAVGSNWPLEICVGNELPERISLARSSQFATGFLLAAAGKMYRGEIDEYKLYLEGELRSAPYLTLTLLLLKEAGIESIWEEREIRLRLAERKSRFLFRIEKDASSLSFLEVFARRWRLGTFYSSSRQGDGAFPDFLARLERGEVLSLKDHPDLAPPLWAAAALLRLKLEVSECSQLRWKESNRARLLVEAAVALGASAEEREDGLMADFRGWVPPAREIFLRTEGDHRMAMAFGLLTTDEAVILPDRLDCVRKSFPLYWQALAALEEALPG